jgi:hypothetical protein
VGERITSWTARIPSKMLGRATCLNISKRTKSDRTIETYVKSGGSWRQGGGLSCRDRGCGSAASLVDGPSCPGELFGGLVEECGGLRVIPFCPA